MSLDFSFLIPYIPQLAAAARVTLFIGVSSFVLALAVSVLVGILRSGRLPWITDFLLGVYVEIFRNTPLLIQLFFIYYGLPTFGIVLPPVTAAVIGLSLNSGAYMSEVVRAAISSVNKGQYETAFCLDPELAHEVFGTIQTLVESHMTLVLVTHQMNMVKHFATRVLFLENSGIFFDGTFKDLTGAADPRIRHFLKKIYP